MCKYLQLAAGSKALENPTACQEMTQRFGRDSTLKGY
jgi:hypothetical protein